MTDPVALVGQSLTAETRAEFEARVDDQAAYLEDVIERGDLDNEDFALGLELEVYAVDDDGALARLPEAVFEACNAELGLHNAEVNTDPDPFTAEGIAAQARSLEERWDRARAAAREHGLDLVLDAMWTTPPATEGSYDYLADTDRRDGTDLPSNMRPVPRYWAIDRHCLDLADGSVPFDVPGADLSFPTILFESLATSIQPHVQIPETEQFPRYHDLATRTMGPVLALAVNSPFLPGDLYDDVDPERVLAETHHELRIAAFEQSVNHTDPPKVRVPDDLDDPTAVVDHVVDDPLLAPFLEEWVEDTDDGFAGEFWEFDHKRGTFWRWLRGVIGGEPVDGAGDRQSIRIEYRPIPTQPSIRDVVGFQCLVGGLLRGLVAADHPLGTLDWADAERCFYSAAANGLDAEFAWITADGERTSDPETVFAEVFEYARRGLAEQGVDDATADRYLDPLEARWEARTTPSQWKIDRARAELAEGADLEAALRTVQEEYVRLSRERDTFADWL
ncbi:hypothetical protein [Halorientalis halophila]|uniref:hypothetical protein n=1 Tax=Halorientalis halophila TaxID=3108499 RepID=UPI0030097886